MRAYPVRVRPTAAGEGGSPFKPGRSVTGSSRCGRDSAPTFVLPAQRRAPIGVVEDHGDGRETMRNSVG